MTNRLLLLLLLPFLFLSCTSEEEPTETDSPSNSINKIMPLGASRVEGARPDFESYRYELWKLMVDGGWDFDYVGTNDDLSSYPSYLGFTFDNDHEGRGGWTSGQILQGIEGWLNETDTPDIILFSSPGGNDALQNLPYEEAVSNINQIIDIIQIANPNVTIIIEQMAPALSSEMTAELTTYFNRMQEEVSSIASAQTTASSNVLTVNMYTGFDDTLLADAVHYNEAGAKFIAERYYTVLTSILEQ